ncbi:MAG: ABC transporter ATP-binding protein [Clostridia bacterium]|nr:ABC transporter ATP-binding protein [Clostridia bacterium]
MRNEKKKPTLRRILHLVGAYRFHILCSLLLAALAVAATLYIPILAGRAIDTVIGAGHVEFARLLPLLYRIAIIAAVNGLSQWFMQLLNNRVSFRVVRDLRNQAMAHIERLPLSYLDAHATGDTVSRIISDADQFADGLLMGFSQLFTGVLTILGTLVLMFAINYKIALTVMLLTPLSLFVARFIARRTFAMFQKQSETRGRLTGYIEEIIGSKRVVNAFAREDAAKEDFDEINGDYAHFSLRAIFFSSLTNPTTRFVNALVYAAVALVGALAVVGGSLTVGILTCFLSYANQYTKPFNEISGVIAELQNALACAERIFSLIDAPEEPPDAEQAETLQHAEGRVDLEGVCFSYDRARPLIENLNLHVTPGSRIAIVGPTGCGKTTLVNLLMRFYEIQSGSISVDGRSVDQITKESLRANFGMVLQDTWLKAATVRENIALGKPSATEEEIISAAKAAHADGFIRSLPQGYDTPLTDDASVLSVGQKQLLCIARVMLSLPPMLILDEATSSIDTRTEQQIQQAFSRMMRGRTVFIVAHRLTTIKDADLILVMQDGKVVEQGNHAQLMASGGFYAELYQSRTAQV